MKTRLLALSLTLGLSLVAGSASAATATGSFDVSATVNGSCVVASASAISFGSYDPTATHSTASLDVDGTVAVRCTAGSANVRVSLDQGANALSSSSAAAPARSMVDADGGSIAYGIYKDAARTEAWGATGAADNVIPSFASSLVPVELTTYARIPGGQNAAIGTYTDTVGVTVTF